MADTSAERGPGRPRALAAGWPARDGIALGLAVGTSGLAFGAAAVASGLSVAQACVLSLVAYTGASQFALAAAVAGGGNLIAGTASAVLLGSRNGLYGLRLASLLGFRGPFRLLAALGITDESTAVALASSAGRGRRSPGRVPGHLRQPLPDLERGVAGRRAGRGQAGLPWLLRPGRGRPRGVPGVAVAAAARRPDRADGRAGRGRDRRSLPRRSARRGSRWCWPPPQRSARRCCRPRRRLPRTAPPRTAPAPAAPGRPAPPRAARPRRRSGQTGTSAGEEAAPVSATWIAVLVTAVCCYGAQAGGPDRAAAAGWLIPGPSGSPAWSRWPCSPR